MMPEETETEYVKNPEFSTLNSPKCEWVMVVRLAKILDTNVGSLL